MFVYLSVHALEVVKANISSSYLDCHCLTHALARRRASVNSGQINEYCSLYSVFHLGKGIRVRWTVLCKRTIKQAVNSNNFPSCMMGSFVSLPLRWFSLSSFGWWTVCSTCRGCDSVLPPPFRCIGSSHWSSPYHVPSSTFITSNFQKSDAVTAIWLVEQWRLRGCINLPKVIDYQWDRQSRVQFKEVWVENAPSTCNLLGTVLSYAILLY